MKIVANNELCAIYKLVLLLGLFLLKWSTALEHCGLCVVNLLWCFWAILLKALPFGFEHWDLGDVTDILATGVETLFQGSILMVYPISNAISVKAEFSQIALKSSFQNLPISAPRSEWRWSPIWTIHLQITKLSPDHRTIFMVSTRLPLFEFENQTHDSMIQNNFHKYILNEHLIYRYSTFIRNIQYSKRWKERGRWDGGGRHNWE